MIRLDAIPSAEARPRGYRLFTSPLSGVMLLGIYINMASILVDKF